LFLKQFFILFLFQVGEAFIFDAIASMDSLDCGKRYLCELAATPLPDLTEEELSSLMLFQVHIDTLALEPSVAQGHSCMPSL